MFIGMNVELQYLGNGRIKHELNPEKLHPVMTVTDKMKARNVSWYYNCHTENTVLTI